MKEKKKKSVAQTNKRAKKLISDLSELNNDLVALQKSSLEISESELVILNTIKNELGFEKSLAEPNIPVGCQWCTASGGV